jgi:hypothetical protein
MSSVKVNNFIQKISEYFNFFDTLDINWNTVMVQYSGSILFLVKHRILIHIIIKNKLSPIAIFEGTDAHLD